MDGDSQRDHPIGTIANGTVSNEFEARARGPTGNWIPTKEKASNYTNHDQNEEKRLTASFDKLNLSEIIDAVSKDRYSSLRLAPSISKVPPTLGPSAQTHSSVPTASTETSQIQLDLARRFNPLLTSISLLGGTKPDSRVSYEAVRKITVAKRKEMESLGWSSFEQILEAASQAKMVLVLNIGAKKFLKIPPPAPPAPPGPLDAADYPLEHRALVSTMIKLTEGRLGAGKSTAELADALRRSCPRVEGDYFLIARAEECGVLRIRRASLGSAWAYLNPPVARTSTISQPSSIGTHSPPMPAPAQLPPKHSQTHVKKTPQMSKPVQSPSPPIQPANPTSPAPQSLPSPTSDVSNPLPLPVKQRLIKILTRLAQGAPRAFADVDEVMRLLRLEYPWAKDEFLLSIITKAEEENIVVRESEGLARLDLNPNPPSKPQTVHSEPSRHAVPKPIASKPSAPFDVAKDVNATTTTITTGSSSKPKPTSSKPSKPPIKPKPVPPKPTQAAVRKPQPQPQPPASQSILAKDVKPTNARPSTPETSQPSKPVFVPREPAAPLKTGYYIADGRPVPYSGGWWY